MKRVVQASRVDEIRRAQAEWEAEDERRKSIRDEERARYKKAQDEIIAPVEYKIDSALRKFNRLDLDVQVSPNSSFGSERGLEVRVNCNQNRHFDEDSALSWDWKVKIDSDGNIVKESGSWSGLQATNESQMESLKQSVAALEFLNSLDWPNLIDVKTPEYEAYFSEQPNRGTKPDFKFQLKEAELEEYIGQDKMLFGYTIPEYESRWNRPAPTWFIIVGETPKQYKIGEISAYQAQRWFDEDPSIENIIEHAKKYTSRIRKDRLFNTLIYPYVELNEETVTNWRSLKG